MRLTVGITGHRDLVPAELPAIRAEVRAFFERLSKAYPRLELQLLSPLAEGADRLAAEVAREMGVRLVVPMPLPREIYEREFDTEDGLAAFRALLDGAEIIPVPLAPGLSERDLADSEAARSRQYQQLGVFISNHSQVLLALWDGKPGQSVGGTGQVVHYHVTGALPGVTQDGDSPNLLADNENDLVYHVVCSRDLPDGGPAPGLRPGETAWITAHFRRHAPGRMPEGHRSMFDRLAEFEDDWQKYAGEIRGEGTDLLAGAPDAPLPAGADFIAHLFRGADWLAIHFRRRVSMSLVSLHSLAVVMGLVFILYADLFDHVALVWTFLALFAGGLVLYVIGSRREWHRKYLDYRALAEGLRVQLYWDLAGVSEVRSAQFAHDNFLQKQDVDLGWIRHVMRAASLRSDRVSEAHPAWVDWVVECWVGSEADGTGQLGYYAYKQGIKAETYRRTARIGQLSLWAGIAIAVLLAVASGRLSPGGKDVLLVLVGVLPLMAGVRDAYSHKTAEKELIKQYRFMAKVFGNARRLLAQAADVAGKRNVLRALGNAALEEHAEWILMHRERPLEQSSGL